MREHVTIGDFALLVGIVLLLTVIFAMPARAACPGGVCPLPQVPKVVKGEVSVIASRATTACRPKCECRYSHNSCKGRAFAGRRVMRRFGR